jgi:hypothetical protein
MPLTAVEGVNGPQEWEEYVQSMSTDTVIASNSCLYALAECTAQTFRVLSGVKARCEGNTSPLFIVDIVPKNVEVSREGSEVWRKVGGYFLFFYVSITNSWFLYSPRPPFGLPTAARTTTCWCRAQRWTARECFPGIAQPTSGSASLFAESGTRTPRLPALVAILDRKDAVPRRREPLPLEGFTFGFGSEDQLRVQYPLNI